MLSGAAVSGTSTNAAATLCSPATSGKAEGGFASLLQVGPAGSEISAVIPAGQPRQQSAVPGVGRRSPNRKDDHSKSQVTAMLHPSTGPGLESGRFQQGNLLAMSGMEPLAANAEVGSAKLIPNAAAEEIGGTAPAMDQANDPPEFYRDVAAEATPGCDSTEQDRTSLVAIQAPSWSSISPGEIPPMHLNLSPMPGHGPRSGALDQMAREAASGPNTWSAAVQALGTGPVIRDGAEAPSATVQGSDASMESSARPANSMPQSAKGAHRSAGSLESLTVLDATTSGPVEPGKRQPSRVPGLTGSSPEGNDDSDLLTLVDQVGQLAGNARQEHREGASSIAGSSGFDGVHQQSAGGKSLLDLVDWTHVELRHPTPTLQVAERNSSTLPNSSFSHDLLEEMRGSEATRALQNVMGRDLHVGIQTEAFGRVNIQTSTAGGQLSAQLALENVKQSAALATHLPSIEQKLTDKLGMNASVSLSDPSGASTGGGAMNRGDSESSRPYGGGSAEVAGRYLSRRPNRFGVVENVTPGYLVRSSNSLLDITV